MDLSQLTRRHALRRGDAPALTDERRSLSHGELEAEVAGLGAGLVAAGGVGRGDRVAVGCRNRVEVLVLVLACARVGAICVPLNWRLTGAELAFQLDNVEPVLVVVDDGVAASLAEVEHGRRLVRLAPDGPGGLADLHADPRDGVGQAGTLADDLLVVHTSGTTGRPKGAVLTQDALLAHTENATAMVELAPDDVHLEVLPLFHVGGLNIATLPTLLAGGHVVLHERFDPRAWIDDVVRLRPAHSVLVPRMASAVEACEGFADADLSSLRVVVTGSTIVPAALVERWWERGVPMVQTYGATETAPVAAHQTRDDALDHPASSGLPARRCEVRVVDDAGGPAPPGTPGMVEVRGASVFRGYWRDQRATDAVLDADGWFRSGDVGSLDVDGRLTVHDRGGSLIISGGENIYPAEVELALADHPRVAELAVVGRDDPTWGQVPVVVVVPSEGQVSLEELHRHLDGRLARFKLPKDVVNVAELPRNALGKVVRGDVAELAS